MNEHEQISAVRLALSRLPEDSMNRWISTVAFSRDFRTLSTAANLILHDSEFRHLKRFHRKIDRLLARIPGHYARLKDPMPLRMLEAPDIVLGRPLRAEDLVPNASVSMTGTDFRVQKYTNGVFLPGLGLADGANFAEGVCAIHSLSAGTGPFYRNVSQIERPQGLTKSMSGNVLVLMQNGDNYYHALIDGAASAIAALRVFNGSTDLKIIAPSATHPAFRLALEYAGLDNAQLVKPTERVLLDSGWIIGHSTERAGLLELRNCVFSRMPIGDERIQLLYISRSDASARCLENEREVEQLVRDLGGHVMIPSTVPVAKQWKTVANAHVIVGPHGAGLANTVFARPGSSIIELKPPQIASNVFGKIAKVCGNSYSAIEGSVGERSEDSWYLKLSDLEGALSQPSAMK